MHSVCYPFKAGLSSLTEAQVECSEKLQLMEQSCTVLENIASVSGSRKPPIKARKPDLSTSAVLITQMSS